MAPKAQITLKLPWPQGFQCPLLPPPTLLLRASDISGKGSSLNGWFTKEQIVISVFMCNTGDGLWRKICLEEILPPSNILTLFLHSAKASHLHGHYCFRYTFHCSFGIFYGIDICYQKISGGIKTQNVLVKRGSLWGNKYVFFSIPFRVILCTLTCH